MSRPFLRELQEQLALVNSKLQELEDKAYVGALSPRFRPKDRERAKELLKRKREIEQSIIDYRPQ